MGMEVGVGTGVAVGVGVPVGDVVGVAVGEGLGVGVGEGLGVGVGEGLGVGVGEEHSPLEPKVARFTANSEVLPLASVAVAVTEPTIDSPARHHAPAALAVVVARYLAPSPFGPAGAASTWNSSTVADGTAVPLADVDVAERILG